MIKLELLVEEEKTDEIKRLLREIGIKRISLSNIREYDEDNTHVEGYRGATYVVEFMDKVKIEVLLDSLSTVTRALDMISISDIDAEVLIYEIMKSYTLKKRVKREKEFSFGDSYRKVIE